MDKITYFTYPKEQAIVQVSKGLSYRGTQLNNVFRN